MFTKIYDTFTVVASIQFLRSLTWTNNAGYSQADIKVSHEQRILPDHGIRPLAFGMSSDGVVKDAQ